ncbi:coiled-coil domain-containing protein [Grimontia hollisae]|uniref:hypothetical protein n=1 Tax=Grimontia hollisae TaxID=673 RepID=UPI00165E1DF0|nr:hypothetical protein [Grimontia hollisae]
MKKHLREIRSLYKNFSYTASREGLPKLKSSLNHSLRLKEDTENIEWNAKLSHLNLVLFNGDFVPMESISRETREAMLESLLPSAKPKGKGGLKKLQQTRRNYKSKVKTSIESERKAGNEKAAQFLQQLLNISQTKEINKQHYLSKGEDIFSIRSMQRLNMVSNYIDAHNALIEQPQKRSARYITESFFKIPHNWNIGDDKVSGQELANLLISFYRKYFPEHNIKLAVIHRDERTTQFREATGDHVHVFVDATSNITGQANLRLSMCRVAERALKLVYKDYTCVDDTKTRFSNAEMTLFGHGLQILFTAYSNVHLFKPKGLISRFNEKTDEQLEINERIKLDSRKPKNQREYQYAAREAALASEIEESKLKVLKEKTRETESQLALAEYGLQNMKSEFNRTQERLIATNQELSQKHAELNEKNTQIQELKSALNEKRKIAKAGNALIKKQAVTKAHLDNEIHQRQRHIANLDESIDDKSRNSHELGELIEKQQTLIDSKKEQDSILSKSALQLQAKIVILNDKIAEKTSSLAVLEAKIESMIDWLHQSKNFIWMKEKVIALAELILRTASKNKDINTNEQIALFLKGLRDERPELSLLFDIGMKMLKNRSSKKDPQSRNDGPSPL